MGIIFNIMETIEKGLASSVEARVRQAVGNAKHGLKKILSRKARRADTYVSKWEGLRKQFEGSTEEVNVMRMFEDLSRAAGNPDPANYFQNILKLMKESDPVQRNRIEAAFQDYYDRYHCAWLIGDNRTREEFRAEFFSAVKEAEEAQQLGIKRANADIQLAVEKLEEKSGDNEDNTPESDADSLVLNADRECLIIHSELLSPRGNKIETFLPPESPLNLSALGNSLPAESTRTPSPNRS